MDIVTVQKEPMISRHNLVSDCNAGDLKHMGAFGLDHRVRVQKSEVEVGHCSNSLL